MFFALLATHSFSHSVKLYGLNNAKAYRGNTPGLYYVYLGSFSHKDNAYRFRKNQQVLLHRNVQLTERKGYYVVFVGPLKTPAEVRALGQSAPAFEEKPLVRASVAQRMPLASKTSVSESSAAAPARKPSGVRQRLAALKSRLRSRIPLEKDAVISPPWYVEVGGGVERNHLGSRLSVFNGSDYDPPLDEDLFTLSQNNQGVFTGAVGYRFTNYSQWFPVVALALRYKHAFSAGVGGNVIQYSSPEFTNYTYNWKIHSDALFATSKINLLQFGRFLPYFTAGVGVAINKGASYRETAFPLVTPRISPAFRGHTNTEFAYNAGLGLDYLVAPQWILSLGFEYQDLGAVYSGKGLSTWASESLRPGSYQSEAAILSVSYLFGTP
jgi:opacity protein-like surface antigen